VIGLVNEVPALALLRDRSIVHPASSVNAVSSLAEATIHGDRMRRAQDQVKRRKTEEAGKPCAR